MTPIYKIKMKLFINKAFARKRNENPGRKKEKTIVFSVNPGRSGSQSLQRILDVSADVKAFHEPSPAFHHCALHARRDPIFAQEFWKFVKMPAISQHSERIYVETSHIFGKGFVEPLIALGFRPKIIFLRRPLRDVALSLMRIGSIPGREKSKYQQRNISFLLDPISDPVFVKIDKWHKFSDYQRCFWYALEMEFREVYYKKLFDEVGLSYISIETPDLSDKYSVMRIFDFLGVELSDIEDNSLSSVIATKHNTKADKLNSWRPKEELLDCEEEVVRLSVVVPPVNELEFDFTPV